MDRIYQLIEEERYAEAVSLIDDAKKLIDCDLACLGEIFFLSGFCRYQLHQRNHALEELMESVRLRPRHGISASDYDLGFVELFERARSRTLCSVEIRILTPQTLAFMADNQISTVYRVSDVPADWIELHSNKYGDAQRYRLIPGSVNSFDLELQELRDYRAFDSLSLLFMPTPNETATGRVEQDSVSAASPCIKMGKYCVELIRGNYYSTELSQIVIEGNWSASVILVLQAKTEWTKLHRSLKSNPARRMLAKVVKISAVIGAAATAIWAIDANAKADDKYAEYLTKVDRVEISDTYRDYTDFLNRRNVMGAFSLCFAAAGIVTYLISPGNERDLIDRYERDYRPSGISLDVKNNYVGVRLAVDL
ncbi:MAG: hypothetical protein JSV52_04600 [Candidatus Zixiibacteriota bacterium]|nr:MAG: hypothetical protein JSV52_04600 [candidate division Zixibacteria bacterium]